MPETEDHIRSKSGAILLVAGVVALFAYGVVFLPWYQGQQPVSQEELEEFDRQLADTSLQLRSMMDSDLSIRQLADERERQESDLGQALALRCLQWTELNESRPTDDSERFQEWACRRYNHYITSGEMLPDEPPGQPGSSASEGNNE